MLKDAYEKIRSEVDANLAKVVGDFRFPNSITPLDMAISEMRRRVREMGYDPFMIKDYNHTVGFFSTKLRHTWIAGGSSFYRIGDIIVTMDNNTVQLRVYNSHTYYIHIIYIDGSIADTILPFQSCKLARKKLLAPLNGK